MPPQIYQILAPSSSRPKPHFISSYRWDGVHGGCQQGKWSLQLEPRKAYLKGLDLASFRIICSLACFNGQVGSTAYNK
jgi:hypothetical protein